MNKHLENIQTRQFNEVKKHKNSKGRFEDANITSDIRYPRSENIIEITLAIQSLIK